MRALSTTLIFLSIIFASNCQTNESNQPTTPETEVYKAILSKRPKEIVVIDESTVDVFGEISTGKLKEILKGLRSETFDNFVKVNSTLSKIQSDTQTAFDYPLMSRSDFEKMNLEPGRYYVFSRVGFSIDGKQAVVIFGDVCPALCGKGSYFLLANKNGFWEIEEEAELWRS